MKLRECPDCKTIVSTSVDKCPNCGSIRLPVNSGDKPVLTYHFLLAIVLVVILTILLFFFKSFIVAFIVLMGGIFLSGAIAHAPAGKSPG